MGRSLWFNAHWLLGITAGVVLAVVGVTGALLSFEDELLLWTNPGVMSVTPQGEAALSVPGLAARVQATPGRSRITAITVWHSPHRAARVSFAAGRGGREGARGATSYADPYTGELLGEPLGLGFFRQVRQVHRWLASGEIGKQIVGASTAALIVLCLTGLYLRWPRRVLEWRAWLTFDVRRNGRPFLYGLHSVAGTCVLIPYLLMGLTGLYWSYGWYRDALFAATGAPRPVRQAPEAGSSPRKGGDADAPESRSLQRTDFTATWASFRAVAGPYATATFRLAERPGQPVQITYLQRGASHDRAFNRLAVHADSGAVVRHERYADKPAGARLMSSMLALHSGSFFGLPGLVALMVASLLMPLFAITGWLLYLDRRRKKAARAAGPASIATAS